MGAVVAAASRRADGGGIFYVVGECLKISAHFPLLHLTHVKCCHPFLAVFFYLSFQHPIRTRPGVDGQHGLPREAGVAPVACE